MALVKTSALISDIKGKLSGSIFQASRNGLMLKANVKLKRSASLNSNFQNNILARLANAWSSLTTTERANWESYSVFNPRLSGKFNDRFMNGRELFFFINNYRIQIEGTPLISPSFVPKSFAPLNWSLQYEFGGYVLEYFATPSPITAVIFNTSNSISSAINNYKNQMRQHLQILPSTPTRISLASFCLNTFGRIPQINDTVGWTVTKINRVTSEISDTQEFKTIIF